MHFLLMKFQKLTIILHADEKNTVKLKHLLTIIINYSKNQ